MRLLTLWLLAATLNVLVTGNTFAKVNDYVLLSSLIGQSRYKINIRKSSYRPVHDLSIYYSENGFDNKIYHEQVSLLIPKGVLVINNELVTFWSGGSSDWVKVYHPQAGKVSEVLDQPTRTFPAFVYTETGNREIILHNDSPGDYLMNPPSSLVEAEKIYRDLLTSSPGMVRCTRRKLILPSCTRHRQNNRT